MDDSIDAPASRDLPRRTLIAGAAWTIPAIALASATTAHAASGTLSLSFNSVSYTGTLCSPIAGAAVTASVDNVPAPGRTVTATLSSGYSFANGATTYSGVTGSDGKLTLPDIKVVSGGNTGTLTATSGATVSNVSVSSPAGSTTQTAHYRRAFNGTFSSTGNADWTVPTGSTVVGPWTTLSPTGELSANGQVRATGVTSAHAEWDRDYGLPTTWIDGSGAHYRRYNTSDSSVGAQDWPAAPGSTVVGPWTVLSPGGALSQGGQTIATGVTSAHSEIDRDYGLSVTWIDGSGAHYRRYYNGSLDTATGIGDWTVPQGSVVVGPWTVLSPAGDLTGGGQSLLTGVTSAADEWDRDYALPLTWVDASGGHYRKYANGQLDSVGAGNWSTPAGSKVVGPWTLLTPSGDLTSGGGSIATGVTSAHAEWGDDYWYSLTWVDGAC